VVKSKVINRGFSRQNHLGFNHYQKNISHREDRQEREENSQICFTKIRDLSAVSRPTQELLLLGGCLLPAPTDFSPARSGNLTVIDALKRIPKL
jgi:hypothetical protein